MKHLQTIVGPVLKRDSGKLIVVNVRHPVNQLARPLAQLVTGVRKTIVSSEMFSGNMALSFTYNE